MAAKAPQTRSSETAAVDAHMTGLQHPLANKDGRTLATISSLEDLKTHKKALASALKEQLKHLT